MTCEDIIQRLLDEKHITVKEAIIMIKALISNQAEVNKIIKEKETEGLKIFPAPVRNPERDFWETNRTMMYGVNYPDEPEFNSINMVDSKRNADCVTSNNPVL